MGRENETRDAGGGDDVGGSGSSMDDLNLTEELGGSHPVDEAHGAVGLLLSYLHLPREDEVKALGGLALLQDVDARWEPLDLDEVRDIAKRGRFLGEEREGMNEVAAALEDGVGLHQPLGE